MLPTLKLFEAPLDDLSDAEDAASEFAGVRDTDFDAAWLAGDADPDEIFGCRAEPAVVEMVVPASPADAPPVPAALPAVVEPVEPVDEPSLDAVSSVAIPEPSHSVPAVDGWDFESESDVEPSAPVSVETVGDHAPKADASAPPQATSSGDWDAVSSDGEEPVQAIAAAPADASSVPPRAVEHGNAAPFAELARLPDATNWDAPSSSDEGDQASEVVGAKVALALPVPGAPSVQTVTPVPVVSLSVKPIVYPGTEAWFARVLESTKVARESVMPPLRPFQTFMLTGRMSTELLAMSMLGIPFYCLGTDDARQCARDWCQQWFKGKVGACFTTGSELVSWRGFDRFTTQQIVVPRSRPDMSSTFIPCYHTT